MHIKAIKTFDELRDQPSNVAHHVWITQIGAAIDQYEAFVRGTLRKVRDEGRASLFASEQRDTEKADEEVTRLRRLLTENAVNYDEIVDARTVRDDTHRSHTVNSPAVVTRSELTYRPDDTRQSWIKDMIRANLDGQSDARQRLERNNAEATEVRGLTTGTGAGGEWVPPVWLVQQSLELARAGRITADQVSKSPLPSGTDSISLPRLATGTATAEQTTQITEVQDTDATTDSVTADVKTLAGQQTLSLQLVEQSAVGVDQIILTDLLADLAQKVNTFVLSNNTTNAVGIRNVTGRHSLTFTSAAPTIAEFYSVVADAVQRIHTSRFLPPTKIVMHPRRWGWLAAQADTAGRPMIVPSAQNPMNASGTSAGVVAEGYVGSMHGLPVFVDSLLPTNLGTGTNEDTVIVMRSDDVKLFESGPRANVFREPLASKLGVLLVVHEYLALHASLRPKSIAVIGGTGLVAPAF